MAKRGRVLRDPHAGPGLLMVEGRQYPFLMEGLWRSEVPAKPGLVVDVEFDAQGTINGITAVPQSQIAKERGEVAQAAAKKKKGAALASTMVAKFGLPRLVATGLLIVSWCFLTAVTIQLPFFGKLELTFWQVLGYLNAGNLLQGLEGHGNPGSSVYGLLATVVVAGPFLHHFWKDKRALLGGLLPLGFMVLVGFIMRGNIQSSLGGQVAGAYEQMQVQDEMMNAISLGLGTYLSGSVAFYLAALSTKQFLAARGVEGRQFESSQKAAA